MAERLHARRRTLHRQPSTPRGPWDPQALHGGAPAALITREFERMEPGSQLPIARLSFEFLKPIRFAPLTLSTRIVRDGRRVQELAAELRAGVEPICNASALRIQAVPADLPSGTCQRRGPAGTRAGRRSVRFALND